jgi:hypothetical protein
MSLDYDYYGYGDEYDYDAELDTYWDEEPDVDYMQEQNDFAHDDDYIMEDQHLDGMYEE